MERTKSCIASEESEAGKEKKGRERRGTRKMKEERQRWKELVIYSVGGE